MANSITLGTSASVPFSSDMKKEEEVLINGKEAEEAQAPIDTLSDDVLKLIFEYATDDCREGTAFSAIRGTCSRWYNVLDAHNLSVNWGQLEKKIRNPSLRSLVDQILFVDRFVSEVIASAMVLLDGPLDESEQPVVLNRIEPLDSSFFSRFSTLTQELRKRRAPIPLEHAVIGFKLSPYQTMQQRLDTALETIWMRMLKQIDFEGAPIPANAEAIRAWLNNPLNADKIARITELDLSEMNLTVLPPEIGNLSQLIELFLSKNRLTTLPPEIGNLKRLTWFDLYENQLTTLPAEIGQLSLLTWLRLSVNLLTTLPAEIANLSTLAELYLSENLIKTLPAEIGNLSKLTRLNLSNNQLTTLPPQIGSLRRLTQLSLHKNQLTTLPTEISKLTSLNWLSLHDNQLNTFPLEIGTFSQLTELNLSKNRLTTLPPQIGNCRALKKLVLYENLLITLPPEIGNLSQLTQLVLYQNLLTTLPSEIGNLSRLTRLYLSQNRLTTLPPEIGNLSQLRWLEVSRNRLTALPPEIGNIPQLIALNLSGNQLTTIPYEIGNLLLLTGLFLDHNPLIFILNKDFRPLDTFKNLDERIARKLIACANYGCHTPLAFLCQQIHLAQEKSLLRSTFEKLFHKNQQCIRQAWAAIPSSSSSSSEAEADLFADRASFAAAVITALQDKWQSLSEEQRYQTYVQVSILAEQPEGDASWGEAHAEENIIRLIDAMELVTQE